MAERATPDRHGDEGQGQLWRVAAFEGRAECHAGRPIPQVAGSGARSSGRFLRRFGGSGKNGKKGLTGQVGLYAIWNIHPPNAPLKPSLLNHEDGRSVPLVSGRVCGVGGSAISLLKYN